MQNKLTKKTKILAAIGVLSVASISSIASPIIQEVKATFKSNITYTLNGNSILEGKGGLVYNNQVYVPLRDLGNTLGATVDYNHGAISIITQDSLKPIVDPMLETVKIAQATIKNINLESKQVIVLPAGKEDQRENYIVLNTSSQTAITHETLDRLYTLQELKTGMRVSVVHSPASTRSLPPQTQAYNITILNEQQAPNPDNQSFKNQVITKVSPNQDYIIIGDQKDAQNPNNQILVHLSKETVIKHELNKRMYSHKDLKEGQKVNVTVGPAATLSIPPQMLGIEIVLVD